MQSEGLVFRLARLVFLLRNKKTGREGLLLLDLLTDENTSKGHDVVFS